MKKAAYFAAFFIKSYSEPFETSTPAGKMQFQMMALIGEFERGTIAQNVKMGMNAKANRTHH